MATLLILAAGMGSRYGGLKQMDQVGPGGQTIMDYSIYDAIEAGFTKVVFIIRRDFEEAFKEKIIAKYKDRIECAYVFQDMNSYCGDLEQEVIDKREKPWGTGHAVLVAKNEVKGPFAVINADDFYGRDGFKKMGEFLRNDASEELFGMVGYYLKNTMSKNGTVNRGVCQTDDNSYLSSIFEAMKIGRNDAGTIEHRTNDKPEVLSEETIVSMNLWGFHSSFFSILQSMFEDHTASTKDNPKAEYILTSPVDYMIQSKKAKIKVVPTDSSWFGVTYQEDKPLVEADILALTNSGVYPEKF